jgi:hypothetical protein
MNTDKHRWIDRRSSVVPVKETGGSYSEELKPPVDADKRRFCTGVHPR